jgi:hypothetical protein
MKKLMAGFAAALGALVVAGPSFGAGAALVFVSNRALDHGEELYAVDRDGTGLRRLTYNDIRERQPVWSPDGTRIAFAGLREGNWDVYTVAADGSDLVRVTAVPERDDYPSWTSDGRLVFQRGPFNCPCRAWIADADGSHAAELPIGGDVLTPEAAPRGRRLAFAGNRDGSWSLYTAQLDGRAVRKITSGPVEFGDFGPRWSPSGNDLVFLRDHTGFDNDLYFVHADGSELRRLTDTPGRVEFWPAWNGLGEILFTGVEGAGPLVYALDLVSGVESRPATTPTAPLSDDFADGRFDSSLWHVIQDPGSLVEETGGRLVVSIDGAATPGGQWNSINGHIGSQCSLPGDFDFQVDYSLLEWPAFGGFQASLNAFFGDGGTSRNSGPWSPPWNQQYVAWGGSAGFGVANTEDTSGTLRLTRQAGVFRASFRTALGWTQLYTSPGVDGTTVYGFGLTAPGDQFAHLDGRVAFDNFKLVSGQLVCPDWWSDSAADARTAG